MLRGSVQVLGDSRCERCNLGVIKLQRRYFGHKHGANSETTAYIGRHIVLHRPDTQSTLSGSIWHGTQTRKWCLDKRLRNTPLGQARASSYVGNRCCFCLFKIQLDTQDAGRMFGRRFSVASIDGDVGVMFGQLGGNTGSPFLPPSSAATAWGLIWSSSEHAIA